MVLPNLQSHLASCLDEKTLACGHTPDLGKSGSTNFECEILETVLSGLSSTGRGYSPRGSTYCIITLPHLGVAHSVALQIVCLMNFTQLAHSAGLERGHPIK